ncbi:MBL fold metallo-hydrolase [Ferrimicrobium sp.]|uniref:MBL fold metallo-hydrolase n=1 Tax=Ferrimicrobium sp. TaxID=2926050 RepID=UPI0026328C44|nr:MBL fold metallo-hydrolase [Ferrimicrobium sp.]
MAVVQMSAQDPRDPMAPPVVPGPFEVSQGVVRILAPNPSPMTLDGTNTYLVSGPDRSQAVVVDPGPDMEEHLRAIRVLIEARQLAVRAVITTHAHLDHAALGPRAAEEFGVPLLTASEIVDSALAQRVVTACGVRVLATPGHSADSVSYLSADGVLLSGDHLLGRGTTAILHPDGSLGQFLRSLATVEVAEFAMIAPGHGPVMDADLGRRVIAYYRAHRLERVDQVRRLLEGGDRAVVDLVTAIYGAIEDPIVAWSARASTLATITYLTQEGDWSLEGDHIVRVAH